MSAATAFEKITDALTAHGSAVKVTGDRAQAQCPAHEDRTPSLSITGIDGQTLLYCHAGCAVEDVLAALGLGMGDLYDQHGQSYRYNDGREVRRFYDQTGKKRFTQRGLTKALPGGAFVYHVDRIEAAVNAGATIYVAEGEKDVHALESLGAVATCSPMGAGNAGKANWTPLTGAAVVIVADQDEPGRRHAEQVRDILTRLGCTTRIVRPAAGKDAADHIAAGYRLNDLVDTDLADEDNTKLPVEDKTMSSARRVRLTPASTIRPRPVRWTWTDRAPVGEVVLTPGRGGVGKSTFHAWLIARLTRGQLPGVYEGTPRPAIIAAAEDSWERTIVPRLIAAGANLELVYRAGVVTTGDEETSLTLPEDCAALEGEIKRSGAVLLSVDPLMSTIGAGLDTHKDREVRTALEPLARLADRTGCTVLGNAHFNKSSGSDPMNLVTGSAAFGNIARAALGFVTDPDNDTVVITQIKNNLGRLDLPSLAYRIDGTTVDTDDGPASVGRLVMLGESERSVQDILRDHGGDHGADRDELDDWLRVILAGGPVKARELYSAADAAGYSKDQLKRAKSRLPITAVKDGMAGPWSWQWAGEGSTKRAKSAGDEPPHPSPPSAHPSGAWCSREGHGWHPGACPADEDRPTVVPLFRDPELGPAARRQPAPPGDELAPCGHPAKAVNTSNGKCALCIVAALNPRTETPA